MQPHLPDVLQQGAVRDDQALAREAGQQRGLLGDTLQELLWPRLRTRALHKPCMV